MPESYEKFLEKLGNLESRGSGEYSAKNPYGYLGKYQMGGPALKDAGYISSGGKWAGKDGIFSEKDFLQSPAAQENAIRAYHDKVWGYLQHYGYDDYVGKTVGGVKVTKYGLIAGWHLKGKAVGEYLESGGKIDPADRMGTPVSRYLKEMDDEKNTPEAPDDSGAASSDDLFSGVGDFFDDLSSGVGSFFSDIGDLFTGTVATALGGGINRTPGILPGLGIVAGEWDWMDKKSNPLVDLISGGKFGSVMGRSKQRQLEKVIRSVFLGEGGGILDDFGGGKRDSGSWERLPGTLQSGGSNPLMGLLAGTIENVVENVFSRTRTRTSSAETERSVNALQTMKLSRGEQTAELARAMSRAQRNL